MKTMLSEGYLNQSPYNFLFYLDIFRTKSYSLSYISYLISYLRVYLRSCYLKLLFLIICCKLTRFSIAFITRKDLQK